MSRGNKQIPGQLTFEMCLNPGNYVVQANDLIGGRQALSLNSAKLIRTAIMQIVFEDNEFKPYIITIKDLSELLNVPTSNIYRDIDEITNDILEHPVYIKTAIGKRISWIKIPWVTRCEYNSDIGVAIKLNEELKPYLLNLKEHYTQYTLDNILAMKSTYAIRIFELLQKKNVFKMIPKNGLEVIISVEEIREACDCIEKYPLFGSLRQKVIDVAVKDINRVTLYDITYVYKKEGRSIVALVFKINMKYH